MTNQYQGVHRPVVRRHFARLRGALAALRQRVRDARSGARRGAYEKGVKPLAYPRRHGASIRPRAGRRAATPTYRLGRHTRRVRAAMTREGRHSDPARARRADRRESLASHRASFRTPWRDRVIGAA